MECRRCECPAPRDTWVARQAYAERESGGAPREGRLAGDWDCPECGYMNFASQEDCRECAEPRPSGTGQVTLRLA